MNRAPVKVLFLVPTLRQTGPTSQLLNIIRHLDLDRFAPVVVTLSPEPQSSMLASFVNSGVPVRSLALTRMQSIRRRDWCADIGRLLGTELRERVVVHSHGLRADVISAGQLGALPRVATARNYPYDDYVMKYGPFTGRIMAWTHIRAFRRLPTVVACSSTLAEKLRARGLSPLVIRNGVDTERFRPCNPADRARTRAELGIPEDTRVGICVGGLTVRKDPLTVIRAVKAIDQRNMTMIFAGSGELEERCRREAEGDGRIRFLGHVREVVPYLASADFFVSAAHSEGLPNAVLEAIACGLPVILSDIEPHREVLQLAPQAGELFRLGSEADLAKAMLRVVTGPSGGAGDGAEQVRRLISAERMSREYQELYWELSAQALCR